VPLSYQDSLVGDPNLIVVPVGTRYFGMKVDWAPFDDVRVRRALNYAVDKQDIVDNVVEGYQIVADGFTPPGMQGYDPAVEGYNYNPTEAISLLSQAGWTDTNDDGILDDGAGTDLTIEMWHSTRFSEEDAIAAAVAEDLRNIGGTGLGATVTISYTDWPTYLDNLDNYPMYLLRWLADYPEPLDFLEPGFHTGSVLAKWTHYSNPAVDTGLDYAKETLDGASRRTLYTLIESVIQDDAPHINLFYICRVYVQQPTAQGLAMSMVGTTSMEKVWLDLPHKVYLPLILKNY
ncbi:MAG: ABC transporter substrate-binding protein, partial [Anaerolineae bacterium]|nr:ABC transporter substrate-binding protein [Anaerolineae bacterium]